MHPPVTTVNQNDHVAAAAYLMKRAAGTALIVTKGQTGEPIGIITDADISHAVADGKNPSDVRIYQLMTTRPTVISTTASIRDAAKVMTSGHFRHLPVIGRHWPGRHSGHHRRIARALLDVSEAGAEEPSSDP
jgi:CBS domain-containing protein